MGTWLNGIMIRLSSRNGRFLSLLILAGGCLVWSFPASASPQPNVLLITVDDMSADSIGAFGCALPGTTPTLDRLAKQGMIFRHAHVQVGNCKPSRNVMQSGRYPHRNGVEGFYSVPDADYPLLPEVLKQLGYFTGIRGKVSHSTPWHPHPCWDLVMDEVDGKKAHTKDASSYYESTRAGIRASREAGRPFYLCINVSDPHKPFYGMNNRQEPVDDPHVPSRIFSDGEVPIPGFLPDHPDVAKELAHYYSSVRRADDCVEGILKALKESGLESNTLVVFLSDHGMPLPFAKTTVYHHGTHTPLMIRWPGKTQAGSEDRHHMVSTVDLMPTLLEATGCELPGGLDGRSFLPLLSPGASQADRDWVFKEYNENSGGARHPMRAAQSRKWLYIWNPWSDGKRTFKTATTGTLSYRVLQSLAPESPEVADRLELFDHRVPEELYDISMDPDALKNLADDPAHTKDLQACRQRLLSWMRTTQDHALTAYKGHLNGKSSAVDQYMARVEKESLERKAPKGKGTATRPGQMKGLIRMASPSPASLDSACEVILNHRLPDEMATQKLHVTLKDPAGKRLERQVVEISGKGKVTLTFRLPEGSSWKGCSVAAFVGPEFGSHFQHIVVPVTAD